MRPSVIKLALATALIAVVGAMPGEAQIGNVFQPGAQVCDDPNESMTLFAGRVGKRRIGYGLTPKSIRIPGPTIVMDEGDCLQITLVNDAGRRVGLHAHGVDYTVASDGTPLNNSCVKPGRTRTYVFQAHSPTTRTDGSIDPGSAGYWHYHDHCLGTEHGTGGIYKGLFGALVVRNSAYREPAKRCVLVMIKSTFNLKKAPNTPKCASTAGDRVEFVVIGHGDLFHTFHLHGHRWVDNRTGTATTATDTTAVIDNKTVGPADSFGFQVLAGEHVGPGAWMYHCHVQGHSDAGMAGIFVVRTPEDTLTRATMEGLRNFQRAHGGQHHEN